VKYGLDKPTAAITIGVGSTRATLQVGKTDGENTYARDASRPGLVFTLDTTLAGDVKKGLDEYRKKDLFEFRSFNAARLRILRDTGALYEFEKVKGATASDPDVWRITAPGAPARDAVASQADDLLTKLSNTRATAFVDEKTKTGLDKPVLTVSASYDGGKFERVRFGRAGTDGFGAHEGEPGAGKIEATALDDILKALDAVATPPPPPAAPSANATPSGNATPSAPAKP
jgi:hypothetical protein